MTKTQLRKSLQLAVNSARELKNRGLTNQKDWEGANYKFEGSPEWDDDRILSVALRLEGTAQRIRKYVNERGATNGS